MAIQAPSGSPQKCTVPHCRYADNFPAPGSWTDRDYQVHAPPFKTEDIASAPAVVVADVYLAEVLSQVAMADGTTDQPLLGVGIETLGHEIVGGVYSNLLYDESFEHPPAPRPPGAPVTTSGGWYQLVSHAGNAKVEASATALAGNHSQRLGTKAVIFNAGLNQQSPQGFEWTAGAVYDLSFYARAYGGKAANVSALLFGKKGQAPEQASSPPVLASANFFEIRGDGKWHQMKASLTVGQCKPAELVHLIDNWCSNGPSCWWCELGLRCSFDAASTACSAGGDGRITCGGTFGLANFGSSDVSLDFVTLQLRGDRLRNSPTRLSLARELKAQGTNFMRFGGDMASTLGSWKGYRGKATARQPRTRPGAALGPWFEQYGATASWSYFEFLAMCEEISIIPVIGLDFQGKADAAGVKDVADIVEYLYGDASNSSLPWAQLRKKDGRAQPYSINVHFQFGNEVGLSAEYADFVGNVTSQMESRSVRTSMEGKLHYVMNNVMDPQDFIDDAKLAAFRKIIRDALPLGERFANDHHEADGQDLNLAVDPNTPAVYGRNMSVVQKNEAVLRNFSALRKAEGSKMRLIVGELDGFSNPGACSSCQLRALQTAAYLNLYQASGVHAISYVNAFERLQQEEPSSGWYQGQILLLPNATILQPPFHVIAMASKSTQRNVVKTWLRGAAQLGGLVQLFSSVSDDRKTVAVRVVSQHCKDLPLTLQLHNASSGTLDTAVTVNVTVLRSRVDTSQLTAPCKSTGMEMYRMMNEGNNADNSNAHVRPERSVETLSAQGSVNLVVPHWSFVTLTMHLKADDDELLSVATVAAAAVQGVATGKIDRHALVSRHNVELAAIDPSAPLTVGNGEFGFTADVTGLQTLNATYASFPPLQTMSHWGWHKVPHFHTRSHLLQTTGR